MSESKFSIGSFFRPASRLYNKPDLPNLVRDNELDLIRFLLASCVVFYHVLILAKGLNFPLARLEAVPAFILLSGLLVTESFYRSSHLFSYIEKRVRRIYPAYLTVVIIGGLLAFLGWKYMAGANVKIGDLGRYWGINSFFANWLQPCIVRDVPVETCAVNGSLWSIKWEVFFYALLPAILILFSRLHKALYIAMLLGLAVSLSFILNPYARLFICFLIGISTFYLKDIWMPIILRCPPIPRLLRQLLILGFFLIAYKLPYGLFILLLMGLAFYPTSKGPSINIMRFGDISYGIYLVHFPLISTLYVFWPAAPDGIGASLVIFFSAIILSIGMYKFIEAPFLLPSNHYRRAHQKAQGGSDATL